MSGLYAAGLALSIGGMVALDARYRLFFWRSPARAAAVLGAGLAVFILWDLWGIRARIFFRGDSPLLLGLNVAPEFPVEELLFLTLLCYFAMNLYAGLARVLPRRGGER